MSPLGDESLSPDSTEQLRRIVVGRTVDTQTQDASVVPPFQSGWSAANGPNTTVDPGGTLEADVVSWEQPSFYKSSDNQVFLEGVAFYAGSNAQPVIFKLPGDYAPNRVIHLATVMVFPDGSVQAIMASGGQADPTAVPLYGYWRVGAVKAPPNDPL